MPWSIKQAAARFTENASTVSADQYVNRLTECDTCPHRKGKRCQRSNESVNIICRYPRFSCPAGRFGGARVESPESSAKTSTRKVAGVDNLPRANPATQPSTLNSQLTTIPAGPRKVYACDVVIPFYHGVKWLPQAIDSILCQRYVDAQIHVVNDQSPEDASAVRAEYGRFENVHWYENAENVGPYASVHGVWDRMTTPYFAVHDADDIALPNRLWRAIHALETTGREIYGASMEQFLEPTTEPSELNRKYVERFPVHKSGLVSHYSPLGNVVNCTMVIRRKTFERLNGFAGEFNCSCDQEFITRAHYAGATFFIDDAIVGLRRVHSTSLSRGGKFRIDSEDRRQMLEEWDRRIILYRTACESFNFAEFGNLHQSYSSV